MSLGRIIRSGLASSLNFGGRASRAEYWQQFFTVLLLMAVGQSVSIGLAAYLLGPEVMATGPVGAQNLPFLHIVLASMIAFAFLMLGPACRRLHDIGLSARIPALLFYFVPIQAVLLVISVVLQVLGLNSAAMVVAMATFLSGFPAHMCLTLTMFAGFVPSHPGPNRYGPNPLEVTP